MRIFLGLTAAAIMATPVVWHVQPKKPVPCHHEGDVAAWRNELSVCRNGFWETGPIEAGRTVIDQ